jgi:NAD(P)H-dependent flavin oxidoreductase YrpB (nitropropane dioxygenase family)
MNRGSTLPLALAVHRAGAYASLSGWTYNRQWHLMQQDVQDFIRITGSNQLLVNFDLKELTNPVQMMVIVAKNQLPAVEISAESFTSQDQLNECMFKFVRPLHQAGVQVFRRIYRVLEQTEYDQQFLTGLMIKGQESAGHRGQHPVREMMIRQRAATPGALLVPYGGVGCAAQVREYMDMGAEIVAVGTALAFSAESTIKAESKKWVVDHNSSDLTVFDNKRNALEIAPYTGPKFRNDENRTAGLVAGLYDQSRTDGHLMVGHSIDHIHAIRPVADIVRDLCSQMV